MASRLRWSTLGPVLLAFGLGASCGSPGGHGGGGGCDGAGPDSDLVGGSCRNDGDCVERCLRGDEFPGGTCSVECDEDRDCPDGTACIDESGGVCLLSCGRDSDCRGGYDCEDESREGGPGKTAVCID